jgi:hypothetical protein
LVATLYYTVICISIFCFMKHSFLLLLLLPLSAFAQYRPMYTPSRPSYTPRYTTSPSSSTSSLYKPTSPYQVQQRQQQYAHQQFQQMQAQQRQQMQSWHTLTQQQAQSRWQQLARQQQLLLRGQTPQQLADNQASQQKAEQQANEQLAHLAQEQQRKQTEHPAPDAQQAAAQQREDTQQLKVLAVRNYQDVFLPGQVAAALQSQLPSAQAQQHVHALTQELLSSSWWKQQTSAQLSDKLATHRANLTALTHELLGPEPVAAAVPTSSAAGQFEALLAADKFDHQVTSQLLGAAAQADKRAASSQLVEAIQQSTAVAAQAAAVSQRPASDQKAFRKQVQPTVKRVQTELVRYQAQVGAAGQLFQTQRAIAQATAGYLAKNEVKPSAK